MNPTPQVSVLMPVRNGELWLAEAIDSVLNQTFRNFELLVIDDGSTDTTPELLLGYARRDSRIRMFRQEPLGLVSALNFGLTEAQAGVTARLDADDVAVPHRLDVQLSFLAKHREVALVGSWAENIDAYGQSKGQLQPAIEHNELVEILAKSNPFIHSSVAFRTAIARSVGGYRPAVEGAEDYDLWLRMSEVAKIANIPERLVRYRRHNANISQRTLVRQLFSVRLAKCAAQNRKSLGFDSLSALSAPPNWWSDPIQNGVSEDDAIVFRFLELADVDAVISADLDRVDIAAFAQQISRLSHAERKIAQFALINLFHRDNRPSRLSGKYLGFTLFRLHPSRALRLIWARARPNNRLHSYRSAEG